MFKNLRERSVNLQKKNSFHILVLLNQRFDKFISFHIS